jgi:acetyltransferase-like isoleucine patch superfamily enzyme
VFIADTAKLLIRPDGFNVGGIISIASGAKICDGVILAPYGGSISIEENVYIGPYSVIYGHGGLHIGRDSLIATHTIVIPADHLFHDRDRMVRSQGLSRKGITIGEDVWIGANVKILDGVEIGDKSIVGAGAVVNKSLPPFSIAVGVPTRVIGFR